MNKKQRRQYSLDHIAIEAAIENKYAPRIAKLISKRIRKFIALYKVDRRASVAALQQEMFDPAMSFQIQKMYLDAVKRFATNIYVSALAMATTSRRKASVAFGFSEEWAYAVIDFLSRHLLQRAVAQVNETTRKLIMDVLEQGQNEGWSVERIVTELTSVDAMSGFRARRMVRTELAIASNFASNVAEQELEFETVSEWVTARDARVRDSHRKMDGVTVDTGKTFTVPVYKGKTQTGTEEMTGPGDPNASASNVINCRCVRALVPKRDADGNLIEKPKRLISTTT